MSEESIRFVPVITDEEIEKTAALANVIWHDCYAHILKPEQIDYMCDNIQSAAALTDQIRGQGYEYYVILLEDEAAGYMGVQAKDNKLLLSKLYILQDFRGKGVGKKSMEYVEQLGHDKACEGVWLTVNRFNERAIMIYRKTGYHFVREQVEDIGGGFVMDDFVFEKPL
ncbi:GNAT family N-acetyltransferase [Clostridia bacterium OttesenSCG-928-O13]|nr:GNAT family N-acetyltransferase [Clostridia bacterium OttesenSCG-928-O13]